MFRGRVVLITGGSRGLGLALARELAARGARIALCGRGETALEAAARQLRSLGAEVLARPCDVGDREQVERMVEEATGRFGRVDILIANAGIIQVGPLETMTVADFEEAMDVMYWGVVYPTLAVLPAMRARRHGRIVTITSIGGKVSVPHLLPYVGAKFAAVGFSEGLRAELAGSGVTVTTIAPGLMRTGSHLNATFKGRQAREFTWFSLGASLPLVSMDAERAARQIVGAMRRGEAERILTVPATLLAKTHGLMPGTLANVFGLVNRFVLPSADGTGTARARGMEIEERSPSVVRNALTGLGRSAARRFHQYPGPALDAADGASAPPHARRDG